MVTVEVVVFEEVWRCRFCGGGGDVCCWSGGVVEITVMVYVVDVVVFLEETVVFVGEVVVFVVEAATFLCGGDSLL